MRARGAAVSVRRRPARLLVAAAVLHLAVTAGVYALGRNGTFAGAFDSNGVGISFAPDGLQHREDAGALSELLKRGDVSSWLTAPYPLHVKLYSVCFALLGPWLGYNVISAEPINALLYLAILVLVFNLGREVFSSGVGLLASAVVALWPSFLLHTTQLLKDPLFVAGMLALVLIILRWLTRTFSWSAALLWGGVGGLITAGLWLTRDNMWEVVLATVLLGALMLAARQFRGRRIQTANLVGMALLIALTIGAQQALPKLGLQPFALAAPATQAESPATASARPGLARRVASMRRRFIMRYPNSGSNIDGDVQFNSTADLLRYLPRAAAIGLFAPFPNMWLEAGKQVGSIGRLVGAAESLVMYAVEVLALLSLWRGRRRPAVWLLFLAALAGLIGLGLVVVNAGALFRLRYAFLILLIIPGAEGAANILGLSSKEPPGAVEKL